MDNLKQFTATLDRFKARSEEAVSKIQRRLALDALRRLVLRTPVGNPDLWAINVGTGRVGNADRVRGDYDYAGADYVGGHARRNWQVTINSPASSEAPGVDAGGGTTRAEGAAVIATAPRFCEVWISNNVPYIEALEHGHSTQAPNGMLRLTYGEIVAKYSTTAEQVIRELGL